MANDTALSNCKMDGAADTFMVALESFVWLYVPVNDTM